MLGEMQGEVGDDVDAITEGRQQASSAKSGDGAVAAERPPGVPQLGAGWWHGMTF
jgi:hypothetical protein